MTRSLEDQRSEFKRRRFLAMPLSGTIVWLSIAVAGVTLPSSTTAWILLIGTGCIFWIAVLISQFTGEDLLGKSRPKNEFDRLFFSALASAWLVFAIAIPFFLQDYTSLPLTVGILAGLMWLPFSWIIESWVGYAHGVGRTALVLIAWYLFPEQRFIAVPLVIVAVYLLTIFLLEHRWRAMNDARPAASSEGRAHA